MEKASRAMFYLLLVALVSTSLQGQAFSVPTSDKLFEVDLTLPGDKWAKVWVREGAMATIRGGGQGGQGYHVAMIAVLDKFTNKPKVTLLEIVERPDGGQHVQKLASAKDIIAGEAVVFDTPKGRFEIVISNVSIGRFETPALPDPLKKEPSPSRLREIYGKSGGECCVTCDDITVCAASVRLGCGSCEAGWRGSGGRMPV